MKVILFKNMDNLGLPGDVVEVKSGYYRNFLQPRGIALEATPGNLRMVEQRREKLKAEAAKIVRSAEEFADRLKALKLNFTLKAGENNRLFGSVTVADIAARLQEMGYEVERRRIGLPQAIKSTGTFVARVRLHASINVPVSIVVDREGGDEEPLPSRRAAAAEAEAEEPAAETGETSSE